VPEQGTTPGYTALTVLAADVTTGKKVWQTDTRIGGSDATNAVTQVVGITGNAVVAGYDKSDDEHFTVALDPATGKTLWTRDKYTGGSVHGDIVAGVDYSEPGSGYDRQITALDAATGQPKWVAAKGSRSLTVDVADPALVVVDQKAEVAQSIHGGTFLLFLDPATGAEKAKLAGDVGYAAGSYGDCFYDDQSVLICSVSGVLTAYDSATARKLWSLPDKAANRVAPGVLVAWHGVLYGDTQGRKPIALDAKTGKDLTTGVGVAPYRVSKYAAIGVGEDGRTPTAYPVKK